MPGVGRRNLPQRAWRLNQPNQLTSNSNFMQPPLHAISVATSTCISPTNSRASGGFPHPAADPTTSSGLHPFCHLIRPGRPHARIIHCGWTRLGPPPLSPSHCRLPRAEEGNLCDSELQLGRSALRIALALPRHMRETLEPPVDKPSARPEREPLLRLFRDLRP